VGTTPQPHPFFYARSNERIQKMEEITDANTDTATEEVADVEGAGSSTDTEQMQAVIDDDGMISTTEFEPVEKEPVEKVEPGTDISDGAEQNTPDADESKQKPYHEDPAWQRIIKERDEAKAELAKNAQQNSFKPENFEHPVQDPQEAERNKVLDEFMNLDDEDLSEMMINEPAKYRALSMQQLDREQTDRAITNQQMLSQKNHQAKAEGGLKSFFADREDGIAMLKTGEIQNFIKENPAHNGISAYYELTHRKNTEKAVTEAVEKTKKETEERIYKQLKAKGAAGSFATITGSRTVHDDFSAEKSNPEKFGGRKAVALALAKKRMAG
jgi:hypothetical protein